MLEVGNTGLTIAEQQTHFAFWAAAKLVHACQRGMKRLMSCQITSDHLYRLV